MKIILNIYSNESKEDLISYQNSLYFITIVVKILRIIEEEEPTILLTPNFKIIFFLINDMFYNHQSSDILHSSNDIILLFNSINQYSDFRRQLQQTGTDIKQTPIPQPL